MDAYVAELRSSSLPLHPAAVILAWAGAFAGVHWVYRHTRRYKQVFVAMEETRDSGRPASAGRLLYQVLFAGFVIALGLFAGGEGFTFFAGGLVVALLSSFAFNLQAWLF